MIKKIEHFWKGLSNDRTQISALPPQEYGNRFLNFISGVTMSLEEASREAQEKDAAQAAAAAAEEGQQRVNSWGNSTRRRSLSFVPPIPNYQPPPPPSPLPADRPSPEAEATVQRAEQEARKTEPNGLSEEEIPDRTLRTTVTSPKHVATPGERTTVLPVVEETAEGSTGDRSRHSHISSTLTESDGRPLTPAKDGQEMEPGFSNPILGIHHVTARGRVPPPTPPKTGHGYGGNTKPESADSGYGISGVGGASNGGLRSVTGTQKSLRIHNQISRDSLDKALPPLPKATSPSAQGAS